MTSKTHRVVLAAALTLLTLPAWAEIEPQGRELRVNRRLDFKQLNPVVALSPGGGALVAWENDQRGIRGLFYGANGWPAGSEVTLVESQGAETVPYYGPVVNPRQPSIAFLANGQALLAWTEERGSLNVQHFFEDRRIEDQDIFVQRFDAAGAALSEKVRVNTTTAGMQRRPRLIARGGGFLIVWEDGAAKGIVGRALDGAGLPVGSEIQVSAGAAQRAAAAANAQGRVLVVWEGSDGSGSGIFGRVFDAAAKPIGGEFLVNTITQDRQARPTVAAGTNGAFLVAWQGEHPEIWRGFTYLYGRVVGSDASLVAREVQLYRGRLAEGHPQISPSLAATPGGGFVLSWLTWPNNYEFGVAAVELLSNAGAPAGEAFWIAERNVQSGFRELAIAGDGAGRYLLVWESPSQQRAGIAARRLAVRDLRR